MNVKLIKIIVVLLIAMLFTAGVVGADEGVNGNKDTTSSPTVEATPTGNEPELSEVSEVSIDIPKPVTGNIPASIDKVNIIDDGCCNVQEITWNSENEYLPGKEYTATIIINVKKGHCFADSPKVKINECPIPPTEFTISPGKRSLTIIHKFEPTEKTTIESLDDITMSIPVAGGTPDKLISDTSDKYKIDVTWVPGLTDGKFIPCKVYTAKFTITANDGYNFSESTTVKMKFGSDGEATEYKKGDSSNELIISDDKNELTFSHEFGETGIETINNVKIDKLKPAPGVKQVNPTSNKYMISIRWDPELNDGKFLPDKVYTAIFNITANEGYQFADSPTVQINEDSVNENNIDFSKENNKLLNFTYTFEQTGKQTINSIKISNLTLPENGEKPNKNVVISTAGIKNNPEVNWNISDDDKFEFGKTYMVTINLTAEDGYIFAVQNDLKVYIGTDKVDSSGITFIDEKNISIKNNYTVPESNLPKLNVIADVEKGKVPLKVTFSYNTTNATKLTVNFEGKEEDIDKYINEYDINRGNLSHEFIKNGKYDVFFNATNKDGTTTKKITITVYNIETSFKASNTSGTVPLTVTFTDTTDKSIKINRYYWDFGDGVSKNEFEGSIEHTFEKPGEYTVTHTVTDDNGNTAKKFTMKITVSKKELPKSDEDDKPKISGTQNGEPLLKLDDSFPQPLGIIQELVQLFLSLFDLSTYGIE